MTYTLNRPTRSWRLWSSRPARIVPPSPSPRILILSASVGAGHIRAAEAIQSALGALLPEATIAHVDVLKLTNPAFRRMYGPGYFRAVERVPNLVSMMYDALDRAGEKSGGNGGGVACAARLAFERMNFTRLTKLLTQHPWDLAIHTHFLPPEIVGWLRRSGRVNYPQATVVTDYDVHGLWVNSPCERYFVANEESRTILASRGVHRSQVHVTGIPIDPHFTRPADQPGARRRLGLDPNRPVILQMAGGFGIGSIERIFRSIRQIEAPLQLVVVTGKNADARRRLERIEAHSRHDVRILGFTSEMHEWMAAADVIVSKPGGLTTSESLARGCAMAIVEPIPGQEDRNSDFLLENGCAIKINNLAALTHKLGALIADPPRLAAMRESALRSARPHAAADIAASCAELLGVRKSI